MEISNLLLGNTPDSTLGGASGGQAKSESSNLGLGNQQSKAQRLQQSAQTLNQKQVNLYKGIELDYKFRLNPFLEGALEKAVDYMNRTLERDGLKMNIQHDENGDVRTATVKDVNNDDKILKEYDPQDVLRYYAHSGYGSGVVVDGKI
mgnify:CR=1 FL=1